MVSQVIWQVAQTVVTEHLHNMLVIEHLHGMIIIEHLYIMLSFHMPAFWGKTLRL